MCKPEDMCNCNGTCIQNRNGTQIKIMITDEAHMIAPWPEGKLAELLTPEPDKPCAIAEAWPKPRPAK